ncbi:fungal-specific transcription factor-like protein [Dichotomopilus funicola]|uniref:Fungal-specific transcription factor-like protein n=1 Tax=Dichotomopilus funicola TaxID=1934379 RepID=A0AAN6ZJI7_9PEZI|nr:fungal-specific transcription factor-like protein [Dichotomopilus funicola]
MVEGESSLTAHSVFANDLVHRVMSGGTSIPEMHERIETLRNMVEAMKKQPAAHEMTYPHAKPTHFGSPKGCDLPPIAKTLELLKLTRANPQLGIAWVFELFEMEHFPETCLALYMAEEYNAAQFITVNVGLHILFSGYSYLHREKEQEYLDLALICAVNVETALLSLPLHLPANDDVIVALSFGVFYAVELGKPALAWVLASKASELCQSLGYHRIGTFASDSVSSAARKRFLFWVVYTLDKSLSLRLGRSSTIHESDVTVPDPLSDGPSHSPISAFFGLWVVASRIQGQIYELLYCPQAVAQPEAVRMARVQLLLGQLDKLDALTDETSAKWESVLQQASPCETTEFFILSDEIVRLSTRTLIHRAVPNPPGSPTTFTEDCILVARETLAKHQRCIALVESTAERLFSTYMNWTILFAPFAPFIVIFCQVIETRDKSDLARLEAFVNSLLPHISASEAVEKLRRLFQALYSVASQYVESQTGAPGVQHQASTVDTCLVALGFPAQPNLGLQEAPSVPAGEESASEAAFQRGVNPMIWMGTGTDLEDWFYSNQEMLSFLGDDVS